METATSGVSQSEPKPDLAAVNGEKTRETVEQLKTQQYGLVLPAEYEELRGYLENDRLLSDGEITKSLYDDTLRRGDLARRIGEKLPEADEADRRRLTDYLWDVHQSVKGLPLQFIDPKQTYRIDVVNSEAAAKPLKSALPESWHSNQSFLSSPVSPVTLHLDINGGFLANFLHNARLNHQQMNRFIDDLEKQHHQLKKQLADQEGMTQLPHTRPMARRSAPSSSVEKSATTDHVAAVANTSVINSTKQPSVQVMKETATPNPDVAKPLQPGTSRPTRYQWNEVAPQFEKLGITRQDLEKAGQLDDLLNGRKTGLMKLTQTGEEGKPFQISGKLYIVNTPDKGPIIGIQPERKQLLLPKEFLGYEFSDRDKQNLEKHGEMGKRVELTDKVTGIKFEGYVGVDKETRSLTVLRAARLHIPQTIKGVTLTKQQQKNLEQGRAIKLEGMTSNNGQSFNAYVQVSAAKRSLTFAKIPDNTVRQTVDQKTAQDLTKPAHQLKGDGAGGKRTIQPKARPDEVKPTAAQQPETRKPGKQQKADVPNPTSTEKKPKKQKSQRMG